MHDLFIYDLNEEEETRLTHNLRANQPSVSNDGKKIVFLFQKDGTTNLGIVDIDGTNFKRLTFFENGVSVGVCNWVSYSRILGVKSFETLYN